MHIVVKDFFGVTGESDLNSLSLSLSPPPLPVLCFCFDASVLVVYVEECNKPIRGVSRISILWSVVLRDLEISFGWSVGGGGFETEWSVG